MDPIRRIRDFNGNGFGDVDRTVGIFRQKIAGCLQLQFDWNRIPQSRLL